MPPKKSGLCLFLGSPDHYGSKDFICSKYLLPSSSIPLKLGTQLTLFLHSFLYWTFVMSNTTSEYYAITCITRIRFPRPWNWSLTVIPFGVVVRRALRPGRQCAGSWKRSESRDGKWPDHLLGRSMEHQESHTQTITKQQSFLRRYVLSF